MPTITTTVTDDGNSSKTLGPGIWGSSSSYQGYGEDVNIRVYTDGVDRGYVYFYAKPAVWYTSDGVYHVRPELWVYGGSSSSSVSIKVNGASFYKGYWSAQYYMKDYVTLSSISGSGVRVIAATETTIVGNSSTQNINTGVASINFTLKATSAGGSSSTLTKSVATPDYTLYLTRNKFTCTFGSNGNPSWYQSQDVLYGNSPSNPGTPSAPNNENRNITVYFSPVKGTSSSLTSPGTVIDTWTSSGWSPSLSSGVYDDTYFYYGFNKKYNGTRVTIPTFSTTTGKPEAAGYTFTNWNDSKGNNVGSEPNTLTLVEFGAGSSSTSFFTEAAWSENSYNFKIYPKVMWNNQLIDIPGSSPKTVTLKYSASKDIDSLGLTSYTGYSPPSELIHPTTGESITKLYGNMTNDLEWYAIYTLKWNEVRLNLNGGNVNGATTLNPIIYCILSDPISLRDDAYVPTKANTTFVGWLYDNQYISAIVPSQETTWPSVRTFTADYIPMGKFIFKKDAAGKGHWYGVINSWVYQNGAWQGGTPPIEQTLINTSTVGYVYKNGAWKIEYGKTEIPLD